MFNFDIKYEDLIWGDKFKNLSNIKFLKVDDAFDYIKHNICKVNVVTHNGDYPIDEKYQKYIHHFPKWYGQNIITKFSNFKPIPIGLENDYVDNSVYKKQMICSIDKEISPKKLLYINHNICTNPNERRIPYNIFANSSWCTVDEHGSIKYQKEFYNNILSHYCTLSPPGNGIDCHRTWEILYLKRIPVLKRVGRLEELYDSLPVIFIDDYSEINESFLIKCIDEIKNRHYNFEKLKFNYWERFVVT
jgi:hypothetical protein